MSENYIKCIWKINNAKDSRWTSCYYYESWIYWQNSINPGFLLWSNFPFFSWSLSHCKNAITRLEFYLILFAIRNHFKYCKIWLKQMIKVPCLPHFCKYFWHLWKNQLYITYRSKYYYVVWHLQNTCRKFPLNACSSFLYVN